MAKLTTEQQHKRMTEAPVFGLVASLSIPTVAAQLMTVIYNTADTWFVSRISTSASAAVGVVFSIMSIIQAFGFCICMGASNLISIRLGEKKNHEAEVIAISGTVMAMVMGVIVGIAGLLTLEPLMMLLGSTETMLPYCCDYAFYIFLSAPLMCGSFVLNAILRAEGEAAVSMLALGAGGILNIILDPIFIWSFNLGIKGAGLATAVSQSLGFVFLLIPYLTGKSIVKLNLKNITKEFSKYKLIVMTGIPTLFRQSMGSVSTALLNRRARLYGDAAVAAITIATKVYTLIRSVVLGVGQGYLPVAGYNYGAGNPKRTKQSFTSAVIQGTAICLITTIPIALYPQQIMMWFRDDPQVAEIGAVALKYFAIALPVLAYSTFVNHFYQCLGFKVRATLLASCRQGIIFIPLLYILTSRFGLMGIQSVQAYSDIITFAISVPFQIYIFRHILNEDNFRKLTQEK